LHSRCKQSKANNLSEPIWPTHHSWKIKLCRLPKIKGSILKYRGPSLEHTYMGERRTTFFQAYGMKMKYAIGNSLRNMSGTWELFALTPHPPPPWSHWIS
jgi:hypothetical protein